MEVSALNDKAVHEQDAQQYHHASGVCNHNVACQAGNEAVERQAKLVHQEQESPEHEEPAAMPTQHITVKYTLVGATVPGQCVLP